MTAPGSRSRTVRTRLTWYTAAPIAIVSAFVYVFFPMRQERVALAGAEVRAHSIAQMTAFTVGPALAFADWETVDEAVAAARQNLDLAWLLLLDADGGTLGAPFRPERFAEAFPGGRQVAGGLTRDGRHLAVVTAMPASASGARLCLGLSLEGMRTEVAASRQHMAWIALSVFACGLIAAYGVSTVVTRPLRHVVETFDQVAAGDLSRRVTIAAEDEIGQLARAFNRMVDHLEAAHAELDRVNRGLELRVQERTRALEQEMEERRAVEESRRQLEEELRQSQKLQAVGQLTAGVAHNFNNALMVVMANLEMALEDVPPQLRPPLQDALGAAVRAAQIVRQLIAFARPRPPGDQPVDLEQAARRTASICRETFDRRIELRLEVAPGLPHVRGDSSQLEQVLLNLCLNARDAVETRPSPRIELLLDRVTLEAAAGQTLAPGVYVRARVRDDGIGMDEETRRRMFEPFFTTKEVGKGTGLGLATVYGIVQEHRGRIECETRPGQGTTLAILLPVHALAAEPAVEAAPAEAPASAPARHGAARCILLVEDEPAVRRTLCAILERGGYGVRQAADGEEGLRRLEEEGADLVVLDLSMPRMSGREVLDRLVARGSTTPVLVLTGIAILESDLPGARGVIRKPVRALDLLQRVDAALA